MSTKRRCNRIGAHKDPHPATPLIPAGAVRSRATLLASASLIALAALGAPGAARATCSGIDQTISAPTLGPVLSTGGKITVTSSGSIAGGPDGVDSVTCSISKLTNSGAINGGAGAASAAGGLGVSNSQTIATLTNGGTITGGVGGSGGKTGGAGGGGVSNSGAVATLTNSGSISGGAGGNGTAFGGAGGAGASNAGTITTLNNKGTISGGNGGAGVSGFGGTGVLNSSKIATLSNAGTISGGMGALGFSGGPGVFNFGTITA